MAPDLPSLAIELIELISDKLRPAGLISLRLACRALNKKSFRSFAQTCFATVRTDLSRSSLQKLKNISDHEQLRHHVRKLVVMGPGDIGRGFQWNRHPSGHLLLVSPMPGADMLRDSLTRKLVNCRSFRVYHEHESEELYESDGLTPSDATALLLAIIAETGLPVCAFHIDFREYGTGFVDARRLHPALYEQPAFGEAWAHLQDLSLELSLSPDTLDWAVALVERALRLRKLVVRLEFDESAAFIRRLAAAKTLPLLQELSLSAVSTTVGTLSTLLANFRHSLRALALMHVSIEDASDWASAFGEMKSGLPRLESIRVSHLRHLHAGRVIFPGLRLNPEVPGTGGRRFDLVDKTFRGELRVSGVRYEGPRMDKALGVLAKSVAAL